MHRFPPTCQCDSSRLCSRETEEARRRGCGEGGEGGVKREHNDPQKREDEILTDEIFTENEYLQ
jgi:hypothetical protein